VNDRADLDGEAPIGTRVLYEDEGVRVWELVLDPGEKAKWHTYRCDYAIVTLEPEEADATVRVNQDGSVDELRYSRGDTYFIKVGDGESHSFENTGSSRYRNILVEVKGNQGDDEDR